MCGEKEYLILMAAKNGGSPPRVRGEVTCIAAEQITVRITPAGAGRSLDKIAELFVSQDHPRGCGEKF